MEQSGSRAMVNLCLTGPPVQGCGESFQFNVGQPDAGFDVSLEAMKEHFWNVHSPEIGCLRDAQHGVVSTSWRQRTETKPPFLKNRSPIDCESPCVVAGLEGIRRPMRLEKGIAEQTQSVSFILISIDEISGQNAVFKA